MTIHSLRKAGNKVRVTHFRMTLDGRLQPRRLFTNDSVKTKGHNPYLTPKGGKTLIEITTPDGLELVGEAHCSLEDNFNRKYGINKALGRALKAKYHAEKVALPPLPVLEAV